MSRENKGNGQGGPGQRNGADRPTPTRKAAESDPEVARALQKLAKTLPAGFSVDEAKLKRKIAEYKNARGTSNVKDKLYAALSDLYDKLIFLVAYPEKKQKFERRSQGDETIDSGADLSAMLVQSYLRRSENTTRRFADALYEAAMQGISAGNLATVLREPGSGVTAMAKQFAERVKKSVGKTRKVCKIEVFCFEDQFKRLQKRQGPKFLFFVERRSEGFVLDRYLSASNNGDHHHTYAESEVK